MNKLKLTVMVLCFLLADNIILNALEYPDFNREFWLDQAAGARGKLVRGIALGITGLGSIGLTYFFIKKAIENPPQFLAYSLVSGIATLGMTGHGFSSIAAGIKERRQAEYFADLYTENPETVNKTKEQEYYLYLQRKTAAKMLIFSSAIVIQGVILLTNGIVLNVRRSRDLIPASIKIWPSYLTGGLLLASGVFFLVTRVRRLRELQQDTGATAFLIEPALQLNYTTGQFDFGMTGQIRF